MLLRRGDGADGDPGAGWRSRKAAAAAEANALLGDAGHLLGASNATAADRCEPPGVTHHVSAKL